MMDDDASASTDIDLDKWDRLLDEQTVLFRKTVARNTTLEARVEELERELSVWKAALKTADEEKKALNKNVLRLERNIGSLKEDHPLIVCLIDGDGNIFSPDLYALGKVGGLQAAMQLTKGITEYLSNGFDSEITMPSGRGQIWLTIFCNKSGLLETLMTNNICTAEEFEAFVIGFNQASPLFSIMDVGSGKEAADSKIKEYLRVFTRFPQTIRVLFGGAHDNGYTTTLNHLGNEGLLEKIILLQGYQKLAREIQNLNLPQIEIQGIFISKKLQSNPNKKTNNTSFPLQVEDFDKFRNKANTTYSEKRSTSPAKPRRLDPHQPLYKQKPPPCNFYYLAECRQGSNCRYAHDYVLLPDQIQELRDNAKKWPCPWANRDKRCPLGRSCCMAHSCPKGVKCTYQKQGRCKFAGKNMHIRSNSARESASPTPSAISAQLDTYEAQASPLESPSPSSYYMPIPDDSASAYGAGLTDKSLLSRISKDNQDWDY